MRASFLFALSCLALPGIAVAQDQARPTPPPAPAAADDEGEAAGDVVVTGSRTQPGAVIGDIPPEQQLGPADIRSYGVSSLSDLLTELAPQTRSDRGSGGAPVVLLNGRRIGSFAEIRDIPTEAIQRVDILPEEVALKYGYRADQRVVNVVLRRRFRATTAELADAVPTEGGRNSPDANLDLLHIVRDGRFNLHLRYQQSSALLESERDIVAADAAGSDDVAFRTLLPSTQTFNANAVYARTVLGNVGATLNGRVETTDTRGLQGLGVLSGGALAQRTRGVTGHLGASFNGDAGQWRWTLAGNYDRGSSRTLTDIDAVSLASNIGRTRTSSADLNAVASGPLFRLPAGPVNTSIRFGGSLSDLSSESVRFGTAQRGRVVRDIGNGQVNLDVPLTSRRTHTLAWVGDLSLNANFAADHLSDFGTLTTIGYGANWSPIPQLRVIASVTDQDDAPTPNQLGDPVVVTPGVRVFDFVTGQTVTATRVAGGNAALLADNRHVFKLGLTAKPFDRRDLTFTANYITTRTRDPIASFPGATAAVAAVFPDRFTRDADGTLTRIDSRPVNFARSDTAELRYGFDLSVPLKSKIQKQFEAYRAGTGPNPLAGLFPNGRPGGGERGAGGGAGGRGPGGGGLGGGGFGGGRGGFGGRGQGGGRLQFALYHTWHFRDTVLLRDGGPALDLLNGQTLGGAGQPRHELEGQAGYANNGIGARLSANWQSGTRVAGGTIGDPDALRFSALATFDLRLFADLSQQLSFVKAHPWARGMRITLAATNLFDRRQRVTDALGATPISYQPDYLDPLGRTVRLSVRKLFF